MPSKEREDARIVSVRLPTPLVQRLDRVLDWQTTHRRRPATRNAALREALRAGQAVDLETLTEPAFDVQATQDSYHVHGQCYGRLRWRA